MDKAELLKKLGPDIGIIDEAMKADISSMVSPHLKKILEYAILDGGKRIRPALTLLAFRLCCAANNVDEAQGQEGAVRLATSFEYLHAASLLHDDVIDRSDQRRGRPSANKVFGTAAVILAGDYLHARAMELAGELGGVRSLASVSRATTSMVEAEFLQAANAKEKSISRGKYLQVLEGKTAALIGSACEVGGLYAGGNDDQVWALRSFGEQLGLAFQVVDDLLDYWGQSTETGKNVGNDFMEGKVTLPLIYAIENADEEERDHLCGLLEKSPEAREEVFPKVRDRINRIGGQEYTKQQAAELVTTALTQLAQFPQCEACLVMEGLASYVLNREK